MLLRLLSWNVNGIRAIAKKGFINWLRSENADIICIQETKARVEQVPKEVAHPKGYHCFWSSAERKGYSGTLTYSRIKPESVLLGMGETRFDSEGRIVMTQYPDFVLFNVYFPNGQKDQERLRYKLDFYDKFLEVADSYKERGLGVVVCGDLNTAHKEIDLARPKENSGRSGFLPVERDWMDKLVSHGYVDSFREFSKEPGMYSWWDYKTRARERNVGWRLDYFFVSENIVSKLKGAFIQKDVMGSDHCPVGVVLEF
jgi:exodeoxyribonuclease-3